MAGSALWLWSSPDASRALRTRELSQILRTYRRLNGVSQEKLAEQLGYDKSYISMIETRRRVIDDVGTLRQIAHKLGIPVHALGVTEADDATFAAMMQFAGSVLALAEIARKAGHAADAVNELWPLVARLESRAAEGLIERESLAVLGRARLSLGVALGTLLPEEKLASAARWTGRALLVAMHLDEPAFTTEALTMHGNELRKAGRIPAAIARLRHAIARSSDSGTAAAASATLARAAGEAGQAELFDDTMRGYRRHLDRAPDSGMLANEFTYREVHLRGLASTGRAAHAIEIMRGADVAVSPAAPQWAAIERITAADVLLAVHEREEAEVALTTGLRNAEAAHLPHQVQRAVRLATVGKLDAVAEAGRTMLTRLADLVASR
ncbi:MAG: helix-turn-helix domain-containing protein [Pseudonocardia sp.]